MISRRNSKIEKLCFLTLMFLAFFSCTDDKDNFNETTEGFTFIPLGGISMRQLLGEHPGNEADSLVLTFRVLAFEKDGNRNCISNVFYNKTNNDIIRHPIKIGTYDFVFLANEPTYTSVQQALYGISKYSDLDDIAYPAEAFSSEKDIPMMQLLENVEVLQEGKAKVDGGNEQSLIILKLKRLGARVDVLLNAPEILEDVFTGVTFSNIPDKVPLTSNYSGIVREGVRSFTLADNGSYFGNGSTGGDIKWSKKINRIVLPSNEFLDPTEEAKSIEFTANFENKYNPSCKLKIIEAPSNYTLPKNSKLDLTATIKMPLEVNIKASEWIPDGGDWDIAGNRILNVSHTKASITDLNGVRITFWSNMPVVRVLPTVKKNGVTDIETDIVFNDLVGSSSKLPTRISYDPATGNGYMDILVDGNKDASIYNSQSGTYTLTLSAEDAENNCVVERTISITVTQQGLRFTNEGPWTERYLGVYFRDNQVGERIITAQHLRNAEWEVSTNDDFIILSSTPSFDPGVGTENPGIAENYPVIPNQYKTEESASNGKKITGKGRIYFRVGLRSTNPNPVVGDDRKPRYGTINLAFIRGIKRNCKLIP